MELYRKKKNKPSIYALCLTDSRETVHHWNAFANGTSGCCIEFDYDKLLNAIRQTNNVNFGKTEYVKLTELKTISNDIEKLPYLKREAFNPESEFRIIALRDKPQTAAIDIPIPLETIRRITISNKLPKPVFESVQKSLKKICPNFKIKISHSTLFNNTRWTNHFEKLNGS